MFSEEQKRSLALIAVCLISIAGLVYLVVMNAELLTAIKNLDPSAAVEIFRAMTIKDITLYSVALLAVIGSLSLALTSYRQPIIDTIKSLMKRTDNGGPLATAPSSQSGTTRNGVDGRSLMSDTNGSDTMK